MNQCSVRRHGRRRIPCAGVLLGGLLALGASAQERPRWTLAEALASALEDSPTWRARQMLVRQAEAGLVTAGTYSFNPELSFALADRQGVDGSTTDWGLEFSQQLEVAGQRRRRLAVAREELSAAEAMGVRDRQMLALEVETAFVEALRARELYSLAKVDAALAREVLDFSSRRLERGVATQIELNLARAGAGRAERSLLSARADYQAARSHLAEVAGADPSTLPEPVGDLALAEGEIAPLDVLVEKALEQRADLEAMERRELAAEAAIRLARAEARPNLVVGGFYEREEGSDEIVGVTFGVVLPVFDRRQGQVAESLARHEQERWVGEALRLAIRQQVTTAHGRLLAARSAAEQLQEQVLGTFEESIELLQRSLAAGRIGAAEVVTLRREFVAGRRETLEALADAWLARIALDLAVGDTGIPRRPTREEMS